MTDNNQTIQDVNELVSYIESGNKPKEDWRMGTEHEKFGFTRDDLKPLQYEGSRGIKAILEGLSGMGWKPVIEDGNIIALLMDDGCSITLEPGGQLELSGALREDIHSTCREVGAHLRQLRSVCEPLDVGFLGVGFQPKWKRDDIPWMPKSRYKIMRDYMPKRGNLGIDMMKRTCTVQVNLDYSSETDMVKKYRTSLALQPIATALFANSPFLEGGDSGYQSYRAHIWTDTDPDRTGTLPFVFESGMGFERYVDYMLDVPMYFVYRQGKYINAAGLSFRDFLKGELAVLPGELPTIKDWEDHLTTAFPEVRLKKFLEMRGADGGSWRRLCALPAFWVGLLYEQNSLDAAWDICRDWTTQEHVQMRVAVAKQGLQADFGNRKVLDIAREVLEISRQGLIDRKRLNSKGDNESGFLEPLQIIVDSGISPAERKLRLFYSSWGESVDPIYRQCAY